MYCRIRKYFGSYFVFHVYINDVTDNIPSNAKLFANETQYLSSIIWSYL